MARKNCEIALNAYLTSYLPAVTRHEHPSEYRSTRDRLLGMSTAYWLNRQHNEYELVTFMAEVLHQRYLELLIEEK